MSLLGRIFNFQSKKPFWYPKVTAVVNDDIVMSRIKNDKMPYLRIARKKGGRNNLASFFWWFPIISTTIFVKFEAN